MMKLLTAVAFAALMFAFLMAETIQFALQKGDPEQTLFGMVICAILFSAFTVGAVVQRDWK